MNKHSAQALTAFLIYLLSICSVNVQGQTGSNPAQLDDWSASEYSGNREEKDYRTAMMSKAFTWLSGSPADNEKLSIGKNAQFFGFVALRYQSGRAANRGILGRAFFSIANEDQKNHLIQSVLAEEESLDDWWNTRASLLRLYENHLYTGQPLDKEEVLRIGDDFARLGALVALYEAQGYSALEASLTDKQREMITTWRDDPELAVNQAETIRVAADELRPDQYKQLEDLFAKSFSWLTGSPEDNEIIPLGQPAQFFGFVSIRHKSGHGANRGQIAKSFENILDEQQRAHIDVAVDLQIPVVQDFLRQRYYFLQQLAFLRSDPAAFDQEKLMELAKTMGRLEIEAGWIEAEAYAKVRQTMTQAQLTQLMQLRSNYVLDETQVETISAEQRGEQLVILCSACHGISDQHQANRIGPALDAIFDRPIASAEGFEYSNALKNMNGDFWTSESLDQFLANPKAYAPGTKMEFQGLLNASDREALIEYLHRQ